MENKTANQDVVGNTSKEEVKDQEEEVTELQNVTETLDHNSGRTIFK